MKRSVVRKVKNILKGKYVGEGLKEAYFLIKSKHPNMTSKEIIENLSLIKKDMLR